MSKLVWIKCKQMVEYSQQHEVSDEEYEIIKDLDLDNVDSSDGEIYDIIDIYINKQDMLGVEDEYVNVQVTTHEEEMKRYNNRHKTTKK